MISSFFSIVDSITLLENDWFLFSLLDSKVDKLEKLGIVLSIFSLLLLIKELSLIGVTTWLSVVELSWLELEKLEVIVLSCTGLESINWKEGISIFSSWLVELISLFTKLESSFTVFIILLEDIKLLSVEISWEIVSFITGICGESNDTGFSSGILSNWS